MRKQCIVPIVAILAACAGRSVRYFVVPANPHYLLRSPDGQSRAFPETTAAFSNGFDGWVDLSPGMAIKLERAYFDPPESRSVRDYIGVETSEYRCEPKTGILRRIGYSPLPGRPNGQPPVIAALRPEQLESRFHRFFFQVVLNKQSGAARAVLLSGSTQAAIVAYSESLQRGDGCTGDLPKGLYCAAVPDVTAASLSFEVIANGKPLQVLWGSTLASVVKESRPVKLQREYRGRPRPVELDPNDPNALRLPLLPGDVVTYARSASP